MEVPKKEGAGLLEPGPPYRPHTRRPRPFSSVLIGRQTIMGKVSQPSHSLREREREREREKQRERERDTDRQTDRESDS